MDADFGNFRVSYKQMLFSVTHFMSSSTPYMDRFIQYQHYPTLVLAVITHLLNWTTLHTPCTNFIFDYFFRTLAYFNRFTAFANRFSAFATVVYTFSTWFYALSIQLKASPIKSRLSSICLRLPSIRYRYHWTVYCLSSFSFMLPHVVFLRQWFVFKRRQKGEGHLLKIVGLLQKNVDQLPIEMPRVWMGNSAP